MSTARIHIKYINLDKRNDRRQYFENLMDQHSISSESYTRYSAVDGSNLHITQDIIDLFKFNTFGWRRGVVGVALSHINLWKELCESSDHDYYLIFEDDVQLSDNFKEKLQLVQTHLAKTTFPFIFLGYTTDKDHLKTPSFVKNTHPATPPDFLIYPAYQKQHIWGGLFSYIIHKDMAKHILDDVYKNGMTQPVDIHILKYPNLFVLYPILATAEYMTYGNKVDSDIHYDLLTIFDDYHFFPENDSQGHDIKWIKPTTFEELKNAAEGTPGCVAFNTYGYMKSNVCHPSGFVKLPGCDSKIHGLYVRREYLRNLQENVYNQNENLENIITTEMGTIEVWRENEEEDEEEMELEEEEISV